MATTTDIGNRALQLLGTRTSMVSLTEASNEATQVNIAMGPVTDWVHGLANWNFARKVGGYAPSKGPPPPGPGAWSNAYAPPPWLYEYTIPTDFIRAIYVTNNDYNAANTAWLGEPKRFAMGVDTVTGTQEEVILTNVNPMILVYTARITDPTFWPWYFERLAVAALASTMCMALTGDKKLFEELAGLTEQYISVATQMNGLEGLMIDDNTPEWIQALGINYPYRRLDGRAGVMPKAPAKGGGQ